MTHLSHIQINRTSVWSSSSVPYLVSVDIVQSIEQHLHDLLDLCKGELDIGVAQQPSQVMLTEVKHQVDAAFVSVELSSFKTKERKIKRMKKHQKLLSGSHHWTFYNVGCTADFCQPILYNSGH